MKQAFLLILLIVGATFIQTQALGACANVVYSKYLPGFVAIDSKNKIALYESGQSIDERYRKELHFSDDMIVLSKETTLDNTAYQQKLNKYMDLYWRTVNSVGRPGNRKLVSLPLAGMKGTSLNVSLYSNADTSLTAQLGPCPGGIMIQLGIGVPEAALVLSPIGHKQRTAVILLSCGNNDCLSNVVIVAGQLSSCYATGQAAE